MTLTSTTSRDDYTGTGSLDTYSYTFKIFANTDLLVTTRDLNDAETTLTLTTDYTVTGVGAESGGTIVLVAGNLTSGHALTIRRNRPLKQTTDIRNQGDFFPETYEDEMDSQIMVDQGLKDEIDRCVKTPESVSSSTFDPELPSEIVGAASKSPVTNSAGTAWEAVSSWPSGASIAAAAANAAAAALSASAAAAAAGTLSPYGINNLGFSTSVAASALTINLKQADGATDPSTGDSAVTIYFRHATLTSGEVESITQTSALSLVVTSGATLGHNDAAAEHIYIYAINNAGAIELAVSSSNHWDEGDVVTTTAMTAASDNAGPMYSASARTNVPFRLIGRILTTQTTAGTWAAAVTRLEAGFLFTDEKEQIAKAASFNAKHGKVYTIDSSGGVINVTPPDPTAGLIRFGIKCEGSSETNSINLLQSGSENIDGTAATFAMTKNYGTWEFQSDLVDWWAIQKTNNAVQTSYTVFDGSTTTGSDTIPTSWASPTLTAATITKGSAVTRSTNTLTFPFVDKYEVMMEWSALGVTAQSAGVRVRNTTDGTTAGVGVRALGVATANPTCSFTIPIDVTDIAKDYEVQWASASSTNTVNNNAIDSENTPRWRIIIRNIKEA